MALYWLQLRPPSLARLAFEANLTKSSTSKRKVHPASLPPSAVMEYAGGLADIALRLHARMWPALALEGVAAPYQVTPPFPPQPGP